MNKLAIRNQVKALLNRNDITDEIADTFIDQAVARIQRTLRVPSMEKMVVYTTQETSPELLVLPNDFLELKHLYVDERTLTYKDLANFLAYSDYQSTRPLFYTRIQGALKVKPKPKTGLEINMVYYGEIPDLVNDTDENFLTAIAPDLLVYGALTFACDYYIDERRDAFEATAVRIYDELVAQATNMEMNQEGIAINAAYNYPEY